MALHILHIFENHEAFLKSPTTNKGAVLLFSNLCAIVISEGFYHKVECHKVIVGDSSRATRILE